MSIPIEIMKKHINLYILCKRNNVYIGLHMLENFSFSQFTNWLVFKSSKIRYKCTLFNASK